MTEDSSHRPPYSYLRLSDATHTPILVLDPIRSALKLSIKAGKREELEAKETWKVGVGVEGGGELEGGIALLITSGSREIWLCFLSTC